MPAGGILRNTTTGNWTSQFSSASDTGPTSGVSGAVAGPFFTEHQDMTVEVTRVPYGNLDNVAITLSGVLENYHIQTTVLVAKVTANYSVTKDYNTYSTSSWVEPQKFALYSVSTDASGNSYSLGDASGNPSGTIGPAATLETIQPWYNRRPWDHYGTGTDSEVVRNITDTYTTTFIQRSMGASSITIKPSASHWQTFKRYLFSEEEEGDPLGCEDTHAWHTELLLPKMGAYHYEQENLSDVPILLNKMANRVKAKNLFANIPPPEGPDQFGHHGTGYPVSTEGFTEYESFRHDYS